MREVLNAEQFKVLKLYIKIDQSIEDDLLKTFVNDAADQLVAAIKSNVTPNYFLSNKKYSDRFFNALLKIVKDTYDNRGLNIESTKYILRNSVDNVINQLRGEVFDENPSTN